MSKKLTRKGLALTTAFAFGLTGLSALPAQAAAAPLSLKASAGKTYTVPLGTEFDLQAYGSALDGSVGSLKFLVSNPSEAQVYTDDEDDDFYLPGTDTSADGNEKSFVIDPSFDELEIYLDDAAATTSLTIQAFWDEEPSSTIDGYNDPAGDSATASRTVTWSKVAPTITLDQPFITDYELTGTVSLGAGINYDMLDYTGDDNNWRVDTYEGSSTYNTSDYTYQDSAGDAFLTFDTDTDIEDSLSGDTTYKAYVFGWVLDPSDDSGYEESASKVASSKKSIVEDKVDDVEFLSIKDSTSNYSYTSDWSEAYSPDGADGDTDNNIYVKTGTKSLTLTAQAYETYDTDVAPLGQPARVTLSDDGLATKSTVVAGGKTLKANGDDQTFATETNANGEVVVSLSATAKDGDSFWVGVEVQDEGIAWTYVEYEDAEADSIVDKANISEDDGYVAVKNGGSVSIGYQVTDQFGGLYVSATKVRVNWELSGAPFDDDSTTSGSKQFSGGLATVTINDETDASDEDYSVYAWVEEYEDGDWNSVGVSVDENTYIASREILNTAAEISLEDSSIDGQSLESEDFVVADERSGDDSPGYSEGVYVEGYVYDADNTSVDGTTVTISAPGLAFGTDNENVFTKDSITVRTYNDGSFGVYVYSHKAGKVSLNVTSGAAKAVQTIDFDEITDITATGVKFSVTVSPKVIASGSVATVVVAATDKWGNALDLSDASDVDVELEVDGAGYLTDESVVLNSKGKATVKLITGVGEFGSTTVSATTVDTFIDAEDELSDEATVLVGVTATAKATANVVSDLSVNVKYASGATVKVYVAGKLKSTKTASSNSYTFGVASGTSGYKLVSVYVDGVRVSSGYKTLK